MLLVESRQAWIENKVGEIVALSAQVDNLDRRRDRKTFDQVGTLIGKVVFELIGKIPLGSLGEGSIEKIDEFYFEKECFTTRDKQNLWQNYRLLNEYARSNDTKQAVLDQIEKAIRKFFAGPTHIIFPMEWLHPSLIKQVYLSGDDAVVRLFYTLLPIPPLSLFDPEELPQLLVERESEKARILTAFEQNNSGHPLLKEKVKFVQRCIRSCLWEDLACKRIEERWKDKPAMQMIQDANTPYRPKTKDPELSKRIRRAAVQVKLFDSVSHLCAASNSALILDDCLYGRENLVDNYMTFRAAVLTSADIDNGDGNVICLGYDLIDDRCLKGRSVGLELDLDRLISREPYCKNGALFFKQCDFGYTIENPQFICINAAKNLHFTHTKRPPNGNPKYAYLQLFSNFRTWRPDYHSEVERDLLVSNNREEMHQILTLNFFRFLDSLCDANNDEATDEIEEIYTAISKLDDEELQVFLQKLGRQMSCSSEFNIYGAYEIDLDALRSIAIYQEKDKIKTFSIQKLCEDLAVGDSTSWNELLGHLPEIAESRRFMSFIQEKVPTFTLENK